jgi:hypothetical protein
MNNHAGRNVLKVDALSSTIEDSTKDNYLIIYNVNVPYEYLDNEIILRGILERIQRLLTRHFENFPVVYQITASYNLVHSITGETRIWTGSFSVRDNAPAQLSGFEDFDKNTFVEDSLDYLEDVENKLVRNPELASNWVFSSLNSVIFNVQSIVDTRSRALTPFPKNGPRSHRTFPLPGGP